MLTDRQYDRLPQILKEIVDNDQQRAAMRSDMAESKVVSFDAVKGYAKLQKIRGELRQGAKRSWGSNLNKNASGANKLTPGAGDFDEVDGDAQN